MSASALRDLLCVGLHGQVAPADRGHHRHAEVDGLPVHVQRLVSDELEGLLAVLRYLEKHGERVNKTLLDAICVCKTLFDTTRSV